MFFFIFQDLIAATAPVVWRMSGGSAALERVEVAVPRSWDFSRCAGQASPRGPRQTAYSRAARSPDILIGEDHPVYGDLPWSLQHRSDTF